MFKKMIMALIGYWWWSYMQKRKQRKQAVESVPALVSHQWERRKSEWAEQDEIFAKFARENPIDDTEYEDPNNRPKLSSLDRSKYQ